MPRGSLKGKVAEHRGEKEQRRAPGTTGSEVCGTVLSGVEGVVFGSRDLEGGMRVLRR